MSALRSIPWVASAGLLAACVGRAEPPTTAAPPVEVVGPYREAEADQVGILLDEFTEATGIEARYTGSADYVADLERQLGEGSTPPSVAFIAQPGLFRRLVADGDVTALGEAAVAELEQNYGEATQELGAVAGVPFGVPVRLDVKSLVWFRPDVFDEYGWQVPATLDELRQLADRIAADTELAPWCLALRAGGATGWPATDWVEDIVLRRHGIETYRGWIDGAVPFSDPMIERSFDEFAELVFRPGSVDGGVSAAIETPTDEVFDGLFAEPPRCAMAKQGDFAAAWLPDGVTIGTDRTVDTFVLPGVEADGAAPLVVGADVAVALDDHADTARLMRFLAEADVGRTWVEAGGYISPKSSIGVEVYPDGFERELARIVLATDELALDASDAMPSSVGTTAFWNGIVSWMAGSITYDELATTLDEAFDAAIGGG